MYWGQSPALDFQSILEALKVELKHGDTVNILIIGSFDCRHVLQTLAKRYTHPSRQLNLFILEVVEEIYVRQLVLLTTALESGESLGMAEKPRLWMEIFGNSLVRPRTFEFVRQRAAFLIKFVTDPGLRQLIPALNLTMLQYKEIDTLENVFLFFMTDKTYNPVRWWDEKLRKSLGVRYDTREGVFDWDFHMRLREIPGCQVINAQEYRYWRSTGVAFVWLETENSEPNLTLVSGVYKIGRELHHCGYMGSIVNGPLVAFGLVPSCEDEDMLRKANDRYLKRSTDLFERKLRRIFHEIEYQEPYEHTANPDDINLGLVVTRMKTIEIEKLPLERDESEKKPTAGNFKSVDLPNVKINFLPCKTFRHLPEKYTDYFDAVWVGHNLVDHVTSSDVFKSGSSMGLLIFETSKFAVQLSQDYHLSFTDKVDKLATDNQYECVTGGDFSKLGITVYRKKSY